MTHDPQDLRTKYLSWCSAQISRAIVGLDAEEVFRLAHEVRKKARADQQPPPAPSTETLSYREAVRLLTDHFKSTLPDFDAWLELYRADPDRLEEEMRDW